MSLHKHFLSRTIALIAIFALNSSVIISAYAETAAKPEEKISKAKVTGIGGIFFKSKGNAKELAEWYQKNLGMKLEPWGGSVFHWTEDKADDKGATAWMVFDKDSDYMKPSDASFKVNYRIDNMDAMVAQLKTNGVTILKGPETHENGKFLTILDPDNNTVELWEPKLWDDKNKHQ